MCDNMNNPGKHYSVKLSQIQENNYFMIQLTRGI